MVVFNTTVFQIPRGTRDHTPEQMEKRQALEEKIRATFKTYGYREIQTPTFETLELFTAKSGDAILDEIYEFTDKSGRKLALRPELTAPVIRCYIDKLQMEPKPLKLFYFGNCYRYDRPQKGRYREFLQAGCEIIGPDTVEAYAELIALAYTIFRTIGLKNINLQIGNLSIIESLFKKLGLSKEHQQYVLPLMDKAKYDEVSIYLSEINIPQGEIQQFLNIVQTTDIYDIQKYLKDDTSIASELANLENIFELLRNGFSIKKIQLNLGIVRGLDYYKGVVFEIDAPVLGAEKQLCGGGAYQLVQLFGGNDVPTAGFAIGFDRTLLALESEGYAFDRQKIEAFVIPINNDIIQKAIVIAQQLRNQGVSTDIDLLRRGIGKALKYANTKNAKNVILVGPKELEGDAVILRDMKTGKQEIVKLKNLISRVKQS